MHMTAKSAIIEDFKYRVIPFPFLENPNKSNRTLLMQEPYQTMRLPAHFPSHFIFNGIRAGGLTRTLIELVIDGEFGAPLVVFNQPPATWDQKTRCPPREAGYSRS